VNCSRGNLLIFKEDLTFATLYGLEKWFRRYDSVLDFDGAFGKGWLHTFESFLFAEPISGGSAEEGLSQDMRDYRIQVMLPDTHKENFVYRENRWVPEKEGAPYHFRMKAEGGYLLEERAEGKYQAYHYDKKGRLVALQSQPGCAPTRIYYLENAEAVPAFTRSRIDRVEYQITFFNFIKYGGSLVVLLWAFFLYNQLLKKGDISGKVCYNKVVSCDLDGKLLQFTREI